jgi:hypothetical protein
MVYASQTNEDNPSGKRLQLPHGEFRRFSAVLRLVGRVYSKATTRSALGIQKGSCILAKTS